MWDIIITSGGRQIEGQNAPFCTVGYSYVYLCINTMIPQTKGEWGRGGYLLWERYNLTFLFICLWRLWLDTQWSRIENWKSCSEILCRNHFNLVKFRFSKKATIICGNHPVVFLSLHQQRTKVNYEIFINIVVAIQISKREEARLSFFSATKIKTNIFGIWFLVTNWSNERNIALSFDK